MNEQTVIDLYVPAHAAPLEQAASAARRLGIDAIVWVVDDPEDLPDPAEIAALAESRDHALVYPACVAAGPGYRYVLLVPNWSETPLFDALEALDSAAAVMAAAAEVKGCALPVGPRHANDATINRDVPTLVNGESELGVVAMLVGGRLLARDLDIEDTRTARRRVLAATGPFGGPDDLGKFATLLPCPPDSLEEIVRMLEAGCGIALEMGQSRGPVSRKKKRRRRRRGKKRDQGGGESQGSPAGDGNTGD